MFLVQWFISKLQIWLQKQHVNTKPYKSIDSTWVQYYRFYKVPQSDTITTRQQNGVNYEDEVLTMSRITDCFGSCKHKIRVFITFYFSVQWGIIILLHNFTEVIPPQHRAGDDTNSVPEVHDGDHWHNNIYNEFGMFGESLEEEYDGAGACYSQDGSTFLDLFDADEYAECRVDNLYYPFASKEE
ncbi:hypothetical protein BDR07DRAFT_1377619 [Suillus spraguei]|nr:hypothetical protein BDR07DRAFT_1377619 [Suillus spraguei]